MPQGKWTGALIELTGDKELERKLLELRRTAQTSIAKPALRAALRVIFNAQKAAAPNAAVRRTLGMRLNKSQRTGEDMGKVGAAVGKNARQTAQMRKSHFKGGRGGVGLSAANVHWFILGTKDRYAGLTTRAKGRRGKLTPTGKPIAFRGRVQPHHFIKEATEASLSAAIDEARSVAAQKLLEVTKAA